MKPKKQKRIRAMRHLLYLPQGNSMCFCIPVSDMPALIEQLAEDLRRAPLTNDVGLLTHILKRPGITGPKGGAK